MEIATLFLEGGYFIQTTMIYTHLLNKGGHGVKSQVDIFLPV